MTLLSMQNFPLAGAATCPKYAEVVAQLGKSLSSGSTIDKTTSSAPRWSLYGAPDPAFAVNVASENDVAVTVKYCNKNNLSFVVQNRGNGWADTFHLGKCGLLINMAALNRITFNANKTAAIIQGGALTNDMIIAAYGNDTHFSNPTCTCLGYLGAILGGGIARDMGLYGQGVDQLLSANVVLASGRSVRVSPLENPDLWYAVRGAAANFGVVTSAIVKAYPTPQSQNVVWEGALTFSDAQLEDLIQAIHDLNLTPRMEIDFLFSTSGPPVYTPMITAIPFFLGSAPAAETVFAPILKLGPISNAATETPYPHWGDFAKSFCIRGGRKPAYGASLSKEGLAPATWRAIFNEFKAFVASNPQQVGNSSILAEYYPVQKAVAMGDGTSSYPFRDVPIHVVAIPQYTDIGLDGVANAFGERVRDLMRATDGLVRNSTYINFAHGDEPLETIYGDSLGRLEVLKKKWDPHNRFNQWFPLA